MKHYSDQPEYLPNILDELITHLPLLRLQIEKMNDRILLKNDVHELATRAIALRFKEDQQVDIQDILKTRRGSDDSFRLWKVYKVIHENLLDPNYMIGKVKENNSVVYRKPKTPKGLNFVIDFNVNMWNLALEYIK